MIFQRNKLERLATVNGNNKGSIDAELGWYREIKVISSQELFLGRSDFFVLSKNRRNERC